jgi:hypothetical protein
LWSPFCVWSSLKLGPKCHHPYEWTCQVSSLDVQTAVFWRRRTGRRRRRRSVRQTEMICVFPRIACCISFPELNLELGFSRSANKLKTQSWWWRENEKKPEVF